MSTLYLIRHGQASFGAADYDELSARGRQQACRLGDHFRQAGIRFDACWSGTLQRQRQTADEVRGRFRENGDEPPWTAETTALDEYDYEAVLRALVPTIQAEDPSFSRAVAAMFADQRSFQKVFGRVMRRWASGRDSLGAISSWDAFRDKVATGLQTIMAECQAGSRIAVFTSGGPIAAFVGTVLDLDPVKTIALSWQLVNASVTRFQFSPGRTSLASFNEQAHLEGQGAADLVTYR